MVSGRRTRKRTLPEFHNHKGLQTRLKHKESAGKNNTTTTKIDKIPFGLKIPEAPSDKFGIGIDE